MAEVVPFNRNGDNGGDGGGPTMTDLTARVEHLEHEVSDIKVTLARMEGRFDAFDAKLDGMNSRFDSVNSRFDSMGSRFDSMVTWKAAFAGLAAMLVGLAGIAWWVVQQILSPLLQAVGSA